MEKATFILTLVNSLVLVYHFMGRHIKIVFFKSLMSRTNYGFELRYRSKKIFKFYYRSKYKIDIKENIDYLESKDTDTIRHHMLMASKREFNVTKKGYLHSAYSKIDKEYADLLFK